MMAEVVDEVMLMLWTALVMCVGCVIGWLASRSQWEHACARMSDLWQNERDRSDNLLNLCERLELALKAERDLLPSEFLWQRKDDHLLAFPTEFAQRVAELHALNTGRTGKISCPAIPDNLPPAEECSAAEEIADDLFPLPKTLRTDEPFVFPTGGDVLLSPEAQVRND